jgi:hypothetical protein
VSPGIVAMKPVPDREFIAGLRQAAEEYIRAVDDWEAAYQKYYRLADPMGKVPSDMEEQQRAYDSARRRLSAMMPRARGLCYKYGLRDPWTGLLRSELGRFAPQERDASALSRAERTQVIECLIMLAERSAEGAGASRDPFPPPPPDRRSLLRKVLDWFY